MAASADLKVRCPTCGAKYRLPTHTVGRHARCAKCQTLFVVTLPATTPTDPKPAAAAPSRSVATVSASASPDKRTSMPAPGAGTKRPPTEDDILRWLAEAESDADRERRVERDEDGLDAFDMPSAATEQPATAAATPRSAAVTPRRASDALAGDPGTAPRLRLHIASDDSGDSAPGASALIRRVV